MLDGRLETLHDLPAAGAFFFGEPDALAPDVARALQLSLTPQAYGSRPTKHPSYTMLY